jgi:hypothetical protein
MGVNLQMNAMGIPQQMNQMGQPHPPPYLEFRIHEMNQRLIAFFANKVKLKLLNLTDIF